MTPQEDDSLAAPEGAAPAPRGGVGARPAALLCYLGAFLANVSMMAFVAPAQRLLDELGLDKAQFGLVQGGYMVGCVVAMLAYGTRLGRLGDRAVLGIAYVSLVAGNVLACWAPVPCLVGARVLIGSAGAGCSFALSRLTYRHFARHRTALVGLLHAAYLAGSLLSLILGGAFYSYAGSWRKLSAALALLCALPLAAVLGFCPARVPDAPRRSGRLGLAEVWRTSAYRRAVPGVATYLVGEGAMAFFLPLYVQLHLGGSPLWVAGSGTLFLSSLLAGRVLLCAVLRRHDELRTLPFLASAAWISLLGVLLPLPFAVRVVLLMLGGFLLGPVAVLQINVGVRVAGGSLDAAIVMTNVMLSAGGIAGSLLIGGVAEWLGLPTAMALAMGISLVATVPLWRIGSAGLRAGQ